MYHRAIEYTPRHRQLTKLGDELLQGTADLEGLGLTSFQKIYFKETKKQSGALQSPILPKIYIKDTIDGFKKWRDNTMTSPSERHLGHYKSLFPFDEEKEKELEGFSSEMLTVYNTIINAAIKLGTPLTR